MSTDTNQGQACETASGTSPISGSCTASSSNTISQGGGVVQSPPQGPPPPSQCTPTSHPTVLTLTATHNSNIVFLTGTLTDTCTGSGVTGATITFTGTAVPTGVSAVTNPDGTLVFLEPLFGELGKTVQAHFAGQGTFGPSNSGTQTIVKG